MINFHIALATTINWFFKGGFSVYLRCNIASLNKFHVENTAKVYCKSTYIFKERFMLSLPWVPPYLTNVMLSRPQMMQHIKKKLTYLYYPKKDAHFSRKCLNNTSCLPLIKMMQRSSQLQKEKLKNSFSKLEKSWIAFDPFIACYSVLSVLVQWRWLPCL